MATLDIDAVSPIDEGFKIGVSMTIPGDMTGFEASQDNTTNGVVNDYSISFQAVIPIIETDKFSLTLPPEMGAPATADDMACEPVDNVSDFTCTVDG